MDLELLAVLADAHPEWSIVMVGPVVKVDPAELPRRANLHYLGGKSYGELPAYLAGWGADTGELSNSLVALVTTFDPQTGFGGTNRGRYSNKAVDEVVRKALATIDDKAREALLQQAARMVQEDVGIIPLHFEVTPWAFRKGLGYVPRVDQYTLAFEVKPTP